MPNAKNFFKEMSPLIFKARKSSWVEFFYRLAILLSVLFLARATIFADQSDLKFWQILLILFIGIFITEITYPALRKTVVRFKQRRG